MSEPATRLQGRALFEHPLAATTMSVLHERGFHAATVGEVCARAGLGKEDLPPVLRDKLRLVVAVFEVCVDDFKTRVQSAFDAGGRWPASLRAAAYETLRWISEYPDATWWGTVGVLEAGDVARAHRDGVFAWAATLIDAGREVATDPESVPPGAPMMAVGAIVETLGRQTQGTVSDDPLEALPRLMYAAVRPYLGEEAARAELSIPPPPDLMPGGG